MIFIIICLISLGVLISSLLSGKEEIILKFFVAFFMWFMLTAILIALLPIFPYDKTTIETEISSDGKQYLQTLDMETLNGRESYLMKDEDDSVYTYAIKTENGGIEPRSVIEKEFIVFEDEEEKPYTQKMKTIETKTRNAWWLVPFQIFGSHEQKITKKVVIEFHVPVKSITYYVDKEKVTK